MKNKITQLNKKIFDFLKKPIITEKSTKLLEQKQYTFDVDCKLTKKQIRKIFENYYNIKVKSIKTYRVKKKDKNKKYPIIKPKKRAIIHCFEYEEILIFKN